MTLVDFNIDEEVLSPNEHAPKAAVQETAAPSAQCRYCPEIFEGATRYFARSRHEKSKHKDEYEAPKKTAAKKTTKKAAKPRVAKAKTVSGPTTKKRISCAESIGKNIARFGKMFAAVDMPMGRALVFSAPATGAAADELLAGTYVDRVVVQRFAGVADKWERLGGVIAFPILVGVISKNPALYDVLEDELREATVDVLIASVATYEKQAKREAQAVSALARIRAIDPNLANSQDPIGDILKSIFERPTVENDGETI